MIYVGIDIASEKHDCCIINESKKVIFSFSFLNSSDGFNSFMQTLLRYASSDNMMVGLEATGIYGRNLQAFLRRNGVKFSTINPLLLKNNIKGTTLRKTKTDKADAKAIALFLMQEAQQPDLHESYHISELKSLTRFRDNLVKSRSKAKIQAKGFLHVIFPEFKNLFSDVFCSSALAILKKYPSANAIARAKTSSLIATLKEASRSRIGETKALALKQAAQNSIGTHSDAQILALQMCLEEIIFFSAQIHTIEDEIKRIMIDLDSPILSIPGIGFILGATILAEIGNIKRFSDSGKILSFAGLEPSIYQSGKFIPSSGTMVKRGSSYLRCALMQAARVASIYSPTFALYLNKKQNEGKHYYVALSHCAKKLIRIIFAVLNKNIPFSESYSAPAA